MTRPRRRKPSSRARGSTDPAARAVSWDLRLVTAWPEWSGAAVVAVFTFLAFIRVFDNDFVNWDDDTTLRLNLAYRGLGMDNLRWMFTTTHTGHYMPVTWISFAFDYLLWGMDPFGYHLTNLLLHTANAILVFLVARQLLSAAAPAQPRTGLLLGSIAAALLFSIHPLRVESVAWATERKDVLCGFFYLLTVLAYVQAWRGRIHDVPARRWYWSSLVFFALALLSKATAMTLPITLLILDIYPLGRLRWNAGGWLQATARNLITEKLPYLALSAASASTAMFSLVRGDMLTGTATLSWLQRIAISCYDLLFYGWKTVLPIGLTPMYELPERVEPWAWPFLPSIIVVAGLAVALALSRRQFTALSAACAGYLVALGPVLGLAHNGYQIAADRYTYLPCLGWALLMGAGVRLAWEKSLANREWTRILALAVPSLILGALGVLTWNQVGVWRDSQTLWNHALSVQPSATAHSSVAATLEWEGRTEEALAHQREAARLRPGRPEVQAVVGLALSRAGHTAEAIGHLREAIRIRPRLAEAHTGLGVALAREGMAREAMEHFSEAVRLDPKSAEIRNSYGAALARLGQIDRAIELFHEALRLDPSDADAHKNLGAALLQQTKVEEAIPEFRTALVTKPYDWQVYQNLGLALAQQGKLSEATEQFRSAVSLRPGSADIHYNLGVALERQGQLEEAMEHYRDALRIDPTHPEAKLALAAVGGRKR
jgi:tetratricopeptide (TPR) repeat protein